MSLLQWSCTVCPTTKYIAKNAPTHRCLFETISPGGCVCVCVRARMLRRWITACWVTASWCVCDSLTEEKQGTVCQSKTTRQNIQQEKKQSLPSLTHCVVTLSRALLLERRRMRGCVCVCVNTHVFGEDRSKHEKVHNFKSLHPLYPAIGTPWSGPRLWAKSTNVRTPTRPHAAWAFPDQYTFVCIVNNDTSLGCSSYWVHYHHPHPHAPPLILPDTGRGPVRQSQSSWCWDTSSPTHCLGGGHSGRSHAQISSHCTSSPSSEKSGEREGEISVVQEMVCLCVRFHSTIQYS